jgi:hypothetical protein
VTNKQNASKTSSKTSKNKGSNSVAVSGESVAQIPVLIDKVAQEKYAREMEKNVRSSLETDDLERARDVPRLEGEEKMFTGKVTLIEVNGELVENISGLQDELQADENGGSLLEGVSSTKGVVSSEMQEVLQNGSGDEPSGGVIGVGVSELGGKSDAIPAQPSAENPVLPEMQTDESVRSGMGAVLGVMGVVGVKPSKAKDLDLPIDQRPVLYGPAGAIKNLRYCGAKTRAGGYCKKPAMRNGRCKFHGGGIAAGALSPRFKTGKYSKYLPKDFRKVYEASLNDPELLSLGNELSMVDGRLSELIQRLDKGESVRLWLAAGALYEQMKGALKAGSLAEVNRTMVKLGEVLDKGRDEYGLWKEIGEQMDRRRSLADTERRRLIDGQYMIDIDKAKTLVAALAASVRKHVTDTKALAAISEDFLRLTER